MTLLTLFAPADAGAAPASTLATGKYAAEHASALADIIAAGASPVTFTRSTSGTFDDATNAWIDAASSTIAGAAMQVRGDPERYAAKGLVLSTMPTFFFVPTLYGLRAYTPDFVMPGDTVVWNGVTLTVRDVDPNPAPDGIVIASRIVVA